MLSTSWSVVVLIVDEFDVAVEETERDSPVAVHPDRPVPGQVPFEGVGPKRRDREVVGGLRHVKQRQDTQPLGDVGYLDTFFRALWSPTTRGDSGRLPTPFQVRVGVDFHLVSEVT